MKNIISIRFLISGTIAFAQANIELKSTDNTIKSYKELKGDKLTVIDFWATWCKPCKKVIPELSNIQNTYSEEGVNVIGISIDDPRSMMKVKPFISVLNVQYPVLFDPDQEVAGDFNVVVVPTLVIINSEDELVWSHEGFLDGDEKRIVEMIEKHLYEK